MWVSQISFTDIQVCIFIAVQQESLMSVKSVNVYIKFFPLYKQACAIHLRYRKPVCLGYIELTTVLLKRFQRRNLKNFNKSGAWVVM